MSTRTTHELTPAEEASFKRNPELGKAMEALRSGPSWDEIRKIRLEAEFHIEAAGRILDDLKRSLR